MATGRCARPPSWCRHRRCPGRRSSPDTRSRTRHAPPSHSWPLCSPPSTVILWLFTPPLIKLPNSVSAPCCPVTCCPPAGRITADLVYPCATLVASPELKALSHCEAAAAAWLLKSWENAASAVSIRATTNRHLTIGFIAPSLIGRSFSNLQDRPELWLQRRAL